MTQLICSLSLQFQTGMFSVGGRHYFIEPLKRDSYSKDHFNESDSAIPHQLYPLKYSHSNIHNSTDSHCGISYNGEYTFSLFKKKHYANMSVQYLAFFHGCKNENFQIKNIDIFLIFAQHIDCGYMLEYPQSLF